MRCVNGLVCLWFIGCGSSSVIPTGTDGTGASGGDGGSSTVAATGGEGGSSGSMGAGGDGGVGTAGAAGHSGMAGATGVGGPPSEGGVAVVPHCTSPVSIGRPQGAPALTAGTWKDIRPAGISWGDNGQATGFSVSPCNPTVLYVCVGSFNSSTGLFRSTDAGASWSKIGKVKPNNSGVDHLDGCASVETDRQNPKRIYVGSGVRGNTMGFWVSQDGGDTFDMPASFSDLQKTQGLYPYDVYDVAVDPGDTDHVLVSFHGAWGWTDTKWNTNSGVLESKDGGASWTVHEPKSGWGTGHAINFLHAPEAAVGDGKTWLLGTQGNGQWRTTDSGATWTKVTDNGIQHGGGSIYYTKTGVLYATGANQNMRSTDNGVTWSLVGPGGGYNGIGGDGNSLYTAKCFGPTPFVTSPESDGLTWTDLNTQKFAQGAFGMGFDPVNGIMYSSVWTEGVWALKLK